MSITARRAEGAGRPVLLRFPRRYSRIKGGTQGAQHGPATSLQLQPAASILQPAGAHPRMRRTRCPRRPPPRSPRSQPPPPCACGLRQESGVHSRALIQLAFGAVCTWRGQQHERRPCRRTVERAWDTHIGHTPTPAQPVRAAPWIPAHLPCRPWSPPCRRRSAACLLPCPPPCPAAPAASGPPTGTALPPSQATPHRHPRTAPALCRCLGCTLRLQTGSGAEKVTKGNGGHSVGRRLGGGSAGLAMGACAEPAAPPLLGGTHAEPY